MNETNRSEVRRKVLTAMVAGSLLVSLGTQAQNPSAGEQGAAQAGQQAGPTDAQVNQIIDLARRQAVQKYLEGLTTNIKKTSTIEHKPAPKGATVVKSAPEWRDPNGNPVSLPTVEGLALVQQIAINQLTNARADANKVQDMSPDDKRKLIGQLKQQAANVDSKFQAFQAVQDKINSVPGGEKGVREKYAQFTNQAAQLDEQSKLETAQGKTELAQKDRAEAARIRTELSGGLYQQFVNARDQYYQALAANPLLGVQMPGESGPFYQTVLQNTDIALVPKIHDAATQLATQYTDQIDRISQMDTTEALWELAGSQYGLARAMAAGSGGETTQRLIDALEATYAGAKGVADFQKALEDTALSIGQAVPFAGLAFTAISIYRDGNDYVVALSDEKNAQAMAPAMGYHGVVDAGQKRSDAGSKLAWNIGLATPQIPGLISALRTGKNVKLVYRFGGKTGTLGREAKALTGAGTAGNVASGLPASAKPELSTLQQAEIGAAKAKALGADPKTVDLMLDTAKAGWPKGPIGPGRSLVVETAGMDADQLARVGEIDGLVADARSAGVSEGDIQAIMKPANPSDVTTWSKLVPNRLKLVTSIKHGKVLVVDNTQVARDALSKLVGEVPSGAANLIRDNVIYTDALKLESVATKLSLMQAGRPVKWTAEEFGILQRTLARPDASQIYVYTAGKSGFTEPIFYRLLTEDMVSAGNQLVNAPNLSAILDGKALLPSIVNPKVLDFVPPSFLVNPQTGELISADRVSQLTNTQIQQLSPEFVQNGIADPAVKSALQARMQQEATNILRSGMDNSLATQWAAGVARSFFGGPYDVTNSQPGSAGSSPAKPGKQSTTPELDKLGKALADDMDKTGPPGETKIQPPPSTNPAIPNSNNPSGNNSTGYLQPMNPVHGGLHAGRPGTGMGSLTIDPNGTLSITPSGSSTTYPGTFGPGGQIFVYPPGTSLTGLTPDQMNKLNPVFTAPLSPLPTSGVITGPNGETTYDIPITFPDSSTIPDGSNPPSGTGADIGGNGSNISTSSGGLVFTHLSTKGNSRVMTGGETSSNSLNTFPGTAYAPQPPNGPLFEFGESESFQPNVEQHTPPPYNTGGGGVDPCLVGTWRSISVESPLYVVRPRGTTLGGDFTRRGGAGIVLKIEEDGTETIDYSRMEPLTNAMGPLNQWSGTATGKITAENGKAAVLSVEKSDLTLTSTRNGVTQTSVMKGLGPASLGENKPDPSYTCDETTLKFKMLVLTLTFKREGGATREKTP